jgi:hypothetical protein
MFHHCSLIAARGGARKTFWGGLEVSSKSRCREFYFFNTIKTIFLVYLFEIELTLYITYRDNILSRVLKEIIIYFITNQISNLESLNTHSNPISNLQVSQQNLKFKLIFIPHSHTHIYHSYYYYYYY